MSDVFSRRRFLGLSAMGLSTVALSACGSWGGKSSGSGSLRAAWYGGDAVHTALEKVLAHYRSTRSGQKVAGEHAAFADYWSKLSTETAARNAPDVMRMSMTYFTDYAGRGALHDLTGYIGKTIDLSKMEQGVAGSGVVDGKRYGVGQSSIANAVFVNRELIESVGAKVPTDDWTWDSLASWAKAVGQSSKGKVAGTSDQSGHLELFEPYARQHGKSLFTSDGKALAAGQDLVEQWWAYWQDLRAGKGTPAASVTAAATGFETDPVVTGKAAIDFGWVQQIQFLQPLMKQELEIMTIPNLPNGKPGLYVDSQDMWSIAATSTNPDAAAELINYLVNDDFAIKTIGVVLGVPPSKHAVDLLALQPKSPAGKAVAYVQGLGDKAATPPPPWPKGYSQLSTLFTKISQDIGFGRSTPSKGAASFYGQSKQILGT
jgi:multiple sugar transport system substrate-binding protein